MLQISAVPLCAMDPLCLLDQARSNPALLVLSQLLGWYFSPALLHVRVSRSVSVTLTSTQ